MLILKKIKKEEEEEEEERRYVIGCISGITISIFSQHFYFYLFIITTKESLKSFLFSASMWLPSNLITTEVIN